MIQRVPFVLLLVLLLAACGTGQQASQPTPVSAPSAALVAEVPTAASAPAPTRGPTPIPTPGPDQFVNPVIDRDFPDPDVLKVGDMYYAYATNSAGKNIQTAKSTDLVSWELLDDALPLQPAWAALNFGLIWAPEVTTWDDGKTFTMYFTARDTASNKQCIGVATSTKPEGPFKPAEEKAFICQADQGGSIDASSFEDEDGSQYVLWKNDGNCCGLDTWLYLQKVATDGLTLEGEPIQLIKQDQAWEGNLIEAPTLWKHNSKYYLFYSANNYAGADYATGYAVADAISGPYTKPLRQPALATDMQTGAALGPGGQDIVLDKDGDTWMLYHAWDRSVSYRHVMLDELVWEGETPVVKGPDKLAQPRP